MSTFNYTPGQLRTMQAMNPLKRKAPCLRICHVVRLIKSTDGSSNSYTDAHWQCNHPAPHRIDKKHCVNCVSYKPLQTGNYEDT